LLAKEITLDTLRKDAPDFDWTAMRFGFGWYYIGVRGHERVEVQCVAALSSYGDSEFNREWRVRSGRKSVPYWVWLGNLGALEKKNG
jgi:hypothetical protein